MTHIDQHFNRLPPHLRALEAEAVGILREVKAQSKKPVLLYSIGKDSTVLLHLALKAFDGKLAFPVLHIDTTWKFKEMIRFRDEMANRLNIELIVHTNLQGKQLCLTPFGGNPAQYTRMMKTEALREALDKYGFDAAIGGARRDEEKSRAKERVFSFRDEKHHWDPRRQRPEFWSLYNGRVRIGQSMRIFPLSNWTELDIWHYILYQRISIVELYLARRRPVVKRSETLIMVDDDRLPLLPSEMPTMMNVRFRTLGCYPLSGAVRSNAATLADVVADIKNSSTSEREGRLIDREEPSAMERKKREGYF